MKQNPLGNEGIKALAKGIMQSNSLVHLDIRSTAFRKEGADSLFKALEKNETVNCLHIGNIKGLHRNMLGGKAISGIETYLKKTLVLTFLDLNNAGIGHEGLCYLLKGLKENSTVKYLDLASNTLETSSYQLILEVLLKIRLKHLDLSQNLLGNPFLSAFSQYVKNTHFLLNQLSLGSCGFSSTEVSLLFDALKRGVALEYLAIDDVRYDKDSLKKLSQFLSLSSVLKSFSSANCALGDKGKVLLVIVGIKIASAGLAENYSLEVINFSSNRITDKGVISLCENLLHRQSKHLKSINLSNNFIEVLSIKNA